MFKNKKILAIAAVAILSVATLTTTAFAAVSNVSGYETMKASLFNLTTTENMTAFAHVAVSEGENQLFTADMTVKKSNDNNVSSSQNFTLGELSYSTQMYMQDGQLITKDETGWSAHMIASNDNYRVESFDQSSNQVKFVNVLLDTLVGDTKNYFITDGNQISLNLKGNQIPELAQLATAIMMESLAEETMRTDRIKSDDQIEQAFAIEAAKLMKEAQIKEASMKATVDDQKNLEDVVCQVKIDGKDAQGVLHTLIIDLKVNVSDVGSTVADKIDLTGIDVIDMKDRYHDDDDYDDFYDDLYDDDHDND